MQRHEDRQVCKEVSPSWIRANPQAVRYFTQLCELP